MNDASQQTVAILEKALARLEAIVGALEKVPDGDARNMARELLELTLDLHGLALAQIASAVVTFEGGERLMQKLLGTPHVRAILLLHGLHPEDPEQRLRQAIELIRPQLAERGADIELASASSASARIRLRLDDYRGSVEDIRREVEAVLVDAAPDLDEIIVEVFDAAPASDAAAAHAAAPGGRNADRVAT